MHWNSSLFFLCLFLCLLVVLLLPVRLQIRTEYQHGWQGTVTVRCLGIPYTRQLMGAEANAGWWKRRQRGRESHRSFDAHWNSIASFTMQALRILLARLRLEQLYLRCRIGLSEPSWTAYSYGFFWTLLSLLPPERMQHVTLDYMPDFQQQRKEIVIQGIIHFRVGQLIGMVVSLLWLVLHMMLEQNRKEQMIYEG